MGNFKFTFPVDPKCLVYRQRLAEVMITASMQRPHVTKEQVENAISKIHLMECGHCRRHAINHLTVK